VQRHLPEGSENPLVVIRKRFFPENNFYKIGFMNKFSGYFSIQTACIS